MRSTLQWPSQRAQIAVAQRAVRRGRPSRATRPSGPGRADELDRPLERLAGAVYASRPIGGEAAMAVMIETAWLLRAHSAPVLTGYALLGR
jgi:hypothetical protein